MILQSVVSVYAMMTTRTMTSYLQKCKSYHLISSVCPV